MNPVDKRRVSRSFSRGAAEYDAHAAVQRRAADRLVELALTRAGCRTFFVADLMETRRVRAVVSEPTIYVLNGLLPGTAPQYAQIRARPVIGSMVELAEWDAFVSTNQWHGGAALHVDTGMNRLGISVNEAAALAPRIRAENHGITLLCVSHATSMVREFCERAIWIDRGQLIMDGTVEEVADAYAGRHSASMVKANIQPSQR